MDQVKLVLRILKQQHFWILAGLVIILGFVFWGTASARLAKQLEDRKSELEQQRQAVTQVLSVAEHPNEGVIDAAKLEHEKLKDSVYRAWEILYEDQKSHNRWPQELGDEFLGVIKSLGPDDEIPDTYRWTYQNFIVNHFPELFEIVDIRLPAKRDQFGRVIENPETGKPVKVNPLEERGTSTGMISSAGSGYGAYSGGEESDYSSSYMSSSMASGPTGVTAQKEELLGKVEWNIQDIQRIRAQFEWPTTPTSFQVRIAQEDLWVYEALLRIIRDTNAGATSYYSAAVKRIEMLQIGRDAAVAFAQSENRLFGIGGAGGSYGSSEYESSTMASEDYEGEPSSSPMMSSGPSISPMASMGSSMAMSGSYPMTSEYGSGMTSGSTASLSRDEMLKQLLINFRYVDQNGRPLPALADPPFAEFKMMPVRMMLYMDQTKIPALLVNCANSSMPVQVRRVSLNPGAGKTINFASYAGGSSGYPGSSGSIGYPGMSMGMSAGFGGGEYGGGGYGSMMYSSGEDYDGGSGSMPYGGGMQTGQGSMATSLDMPVEVQGIIFIFNPPDRTKLGTGSAGDASETAAAMPLTPLVPVATPAPEPGVAGAAPAGAPGPGTAPAPGTQPPAAVPGVAGPTVEPAPVGAPAVPANQAPGGGAAPPAGPAGPAPGVQPPMLPGGGVPMPPGPAPGGQPPMQPGATAPAPAGAVPAAENP